MLSGRQTFYKLCYSEIGCKLTNELINLSIFKRRKIVFKTGKKNTNSVSGAIDDFTFLASLA